MARHGFWQWVVEVHLLLLTNVSKCETFETVNHSSSLYCNMDTVTVFTSRSNRLKTKFYDRSQTLLFNFILTSVTVTTALYKSTNRLAQASAVVTQPQTAYGMPREMAPDLRVIQSLGVISTGCMHSRYQPWRLVDRQRGVFEAITQPKVTHKGKQLTTSNHI